MCLVGVLMERGAYCYGSTQNRATEKVGKSLMEEVSFKLVLKQEMIVSQTKWGMGNVPTSEW